MAWQRILRLAFACVTALYGAGTGANTDWRYEETSTRSAADAHGVLVTTRIRVFDTYGYDHDVTIVEPGEYFRPPIPGFTEGDETQPRAIVSRRHG